MKRSIYIFIWAAFSCLPVKAATNFVGDVNAQYGSFFATYNVQAINGWMYAGSYVYAGSYMQTAGSVYIGNNLAIGYPSSTAVGTYASALGAKSTAGSYSCVVVGRNNIDKASDGTTVVAGSWVDKDPLFVVGNGNGTAGDPNQTRNALAVYKDGTVTMSKSQGDISMGQFAN